MSDEVEAAGAAVTAGLAGVALDGGGGKAGVAHSSCPNCAAVIDGNYCANCGQPAHLHRSLGHLFEEALHGIVHFDAKAWRTLPKLLFRPGTLTSEYIHGKRARHISPLAMFLLTVFLMFFAFAFVHPSFVTPEIGGVSEAALHDADLAKLQELRVKALERVRGAEAELAEAETEAAAIRAAGGPGAAGEARGVLATANVAVRLSRRALERIDARIAELTSAGAGGAPSAAVGEGLQAAAGAREDAAPAAGGETWQEVWRDAVRTGAVRVSTGDKKRDAKIVQKLENPDLLIYKLQQTSYKFSWLLVPLSLPLVGLLFLWKRGVTWFDHGVFTLYSLSFTSLVALVFGLSLEGPEWVGDLGAALLLTIPVHMYFHVKGAYGLGWWSAAWRTWFLLWFALCALLFFFAGIVIIGFVA